MGIGVHNFAVNLKLLYKMKILKKKKKHLSICLYILCQLVINDIYKNLLNNVGKFST